MKNVPITDILPSLYETVYSIKACYGVTSNPKIWQDLEMIYQINIDQQRSKIISKITNQLLFFGGRYVVRMYRLDGGYTNTKKKEIRQHLINLEGILNEYPELKNLLGYLKDILIGEQSKKFLSPKVIKGFNAHVELKAFCDKVGKLLPRTIKLEKPTTNSEVLVNWDN